MQEEVRRHRGGGGGGRRCRRRRRRHRQPPWWDVIFLPDSEMEVSQTVKAIQSICQPTDYKEACVNTLTAAAGANHVKQVFNQSALLKEAAADPRTKHALENCEELLEYAVDDLKNSAAQLGAVDLSKMNKVVEDLKVWLSAAITYQETCLDGFENATGDAGAAMRKAMNASMALTQNTLAIVNDVSSVFTSFQIPSFTRRLLSSDDQEPEDDQQPRWVDAGRRRLLALEAAELSADIVVAKDGSGNFTTINEALAAVPKKKNTTTVIQPQPHQPHDDRRRSHEDQDHRRLNFVDGTPTFKTATFEHGGGGEAPGGGAEGAVGHVHLLQLPDGRFYRDCTISGTIDFVFGNSAVVFQNCLLLVRRPLENQQNIVTAQGRKDRREPTGIVLQNCTIAADEEYFPVRRRLRSYLGRPWKEYSRTLVMQSQIDDLIDPQGWLPTGGPGGDDAEGDVERSEKTSHERAVKFTAEIFIQGNRWIKPSGRLILWAFLPDGPIRKTTWRCSRPGAAQTLKPLLFLRPLAFSNFLPLART
ncbi:unnamed protein product [Spirodela intermedia]|uniref:Pectinesterase n=1 Tax=Spirodela intermedia TaxID=51605 RepID=A0A7I8J0T5_SPIIN|nr:unnamed protein product [Spirodela intermedia]CAA6663423.1 unnamed protein product [Spirodela intermedia]